MDENKTTDNRFVRLLGEYNKGRALLELEADLADLVQSVQDVGKAGELRVVVKVAPQSGKGSDAMSVTVDINNRQPKHPLATSLFFTGNDGELSRVPVNQRDWIDEAEEKLKAKKQA